MMGSSGTMRRPFFRVMAVPVAGALRIVKLGIRSRPHPASSGSSQKLWKSLWKTPSIRAIAPRQSDVSSGLHHDGACQRVEQVIIHSDMHIVIADSLPESAASPFLERGWTVDARSGRSPADLARDLEHADALIVRSATQVTASLLDAASRLRVIAR